MKHIKYIILLILFTACINRERPVEIEKLLGNDYRLFQNTPAWELAKAVQDGNIKKMREQVIDRKINVDTKDPKYGGTLLQLAISNRQIKSITELLELGANPNEPDKYRGQAAMHIASKKVYTSHPEYLKLLLKYGGDPNLCEYGPGPEHGSARFFPLYIAAGEDIKLAEVLINAGADVNQKLIDSDKTPLFNALFNQKIDIVLLLLEHGADYKLTYRNPVLNHQEDICFMLRKMMFRIGSKNHKVKMQVVKWLKVHGVDYKSTPIPAYTEKKIDAIYPDKAEYYKKNY